MTHETRPLRPALTSVLFSVLLMFTSACNEADDQRLIPADQQTIFNPAPTDFKPAQNAKHQVLIAIVDTGVDYLHPSLKTHFHFSTDAAGTPTGDGYDFVGKDSWSYPTLARTEALRSDASETILAEEQGWQEGTDWAITQQPSYASFLQRNRLHKFEAKLSIFHGTHVAGLASYDDDRIGLLSYRVLPFNRETTPDYDYEKIFVENLVAAFDLAEKAGAKVVNLSIGTSFSQDDPSYERLKRFEKLFADAVKQKPEMVFVAAAGNDAKWIDGKSRFSYPCGVKATNLLCVAALKEDGNLADFTNIPLIGSPLIFALGTEVLSTYPTNFCNSDALTTLDTASATWMTRQGLGQELETYRKRLLERLTTGCTNLPLYVRLSGTSMASPIAARMLAQTAIDHPTAKGQELIQLLLDSAERGSVGPLPIYKLRAPLPSWYKQPGGEFRFFSTPSHAKSKF